MRVKGHSRPLGCVRLHPWWSAIRKGAWLLPNRSPWRRVMGAWPTTEKKQINLIPKKPCCLIPILMDLIPILDMGISFISRNLSHQFQFQFLQVLMSCTQDPQSTVGILSPLSDVGGAWCITPSILLEITRPLVGVVIAWAGRRGQLSRETAQGKQKWLVQQV